MIPLFHSQGSVLRWILSMETIQGRAERRKLWTPSRPLRRSLLRTMSGEEADTDGSRPSKQRTSPMVIRHSTVPPNDWRISCKRL
jgi:hypothetical protein